MDELRRVAGEAGETAARIALAWVIGRPGISSTLMGVSRVPQAIDNVAALDVTLSREHRAALDKISQAEPRMLHSLFTPALRQQVVFGGSPVRSGR